MINPIQPLMLASATHENNKIIDAGTDLDGSTETGNESTTFVAIILPMMQNNDELNDQALEIPVLVEGQHEIESHALADSTTATSKSTSTSAASSAIEDEELNALMNIEFFYPTTSQQTDQLTVLTEQTTENQNTTVDEDEKSLNADDEMAISSVNTITNATVQTTNNQQIPIDFAYSQRPFDYNTADLAGENLKQESDNKALTALLSAQLKPIDINDTAQSTLPDADLNNLTRLPKHSQALTQLADTDTNTVPLNEQLKTSATAIDPAALIEQENVELEQQLEPYTASESITIPTMNQDAAPAQSTPLTQKLELITSVVAPDWGENFNQQIIWLGQQKVHSAVIKLNPQELGPLEVTIKLDNDNAALAISTHTNQVRELIEQALPQLKDMMLDQGITLTDVNIESNANQRESTEQPSQDNLYRRPKFTPEAEELFGLKTVMIKKGQGIIDYFA